MITHLVITVELVDSELPNSTIVANDKALSASVVVGSEEAESACMQINITNIDAVRWYISWSLPLLIQAQHPSPASTGSKEPLGNAYRRQLGQYRAVSSESVAESQC